MSNVTIYHTTPKTVVKDYQALLQPFLKKFPKNKSVIIKLNLSWTKPYPACSSPPWQLEGVIRSLLESGYSPKQIVPVENRTVVTDIDRGAQNHGWLQVCQRLGVKFQPLTQQKYISYRPKSKMAVLNQIFPDGILLPEVIFDKPLISLCTLKTHVFTQVTGSVKNYFGMLNTRRHWAHRFIHEAIIDLLKIQQEIHPQILGVMDGTVYGHGPGPRAMTWSEANLLLASQDEIALDSASARILGLNPNKIPFLKLGQKEKLGVIKPQQTKLVKLKKIPVFRGLVGETFASQGQKIIYHHSPLWLEKILLQTVIAPWSYLASKLYYDFFWYQLVGKKRVKKYFQTPWGKLFSTYQA